MYIKRLDLVVMMIINNSHQHIQYTPTITSWQLFQNIPKVFIMLCTYKGIYFSPYLQIYSGLHLIFSSNLTENRTETANLA